MLIKRAAPTEKGLHTKTMIKIVNPTTIIPITITAIKETTIAGNVF